MIENREEMLRAAAMMKILPSENEEELLTDAIRNAKQMGMLLGSVQASAGVTAETSTFCPVREDIVVPSLPVEDVLLNAPAVLNQQIVVPLTVAKRQK